MHTANGSFFESLEQRRMLSGGLAAPTSLKAIPVSPTGLVLRWVDNADGETGYKVQRSTDGLIYKTINTIDANSTEYRNGKLVTGQLYFYRVRAFNDLGNSPFSNVAKATCKPPVVSNPPIAAPTSPKAVPVSSTGIVLTWVDNANNEKHYEVERSTDGTTFNLLNTIDADSTLYRNGNLTTGVKYYYRVRATGDAGESPWSKIAAATCKPPPPPPPLVAADRLGTAALSSSSIRVTWFDNSTGEDGYKVEHSTDGGTTFKQIAQLPANSTAYIDTNLLSSKKYYYRVRPFNDAEGNGPYSNVVGRTTPAPGATPDWANGGAGQYATGNVFFDGVNVTLAADPAQVIPQLKALHAGAVRIFFTKVPSWDLVGGDDGIAAAKAYHDAGFRVMMEIGDDKVPTYDQAFAFFQYAAGKKNALSSVDYWEVGNEPNIGGFWKGTPDQYVNIVEQAGWNALHPLGETVVGAGPTFDVNFCKTLVADGYLNFCDIANFHPYGSSADQILQRATGAQAAFAGKPVLFSEYNVRGIGGHDAWAAEVDKTRKLLAKIGADSAFYFTLFVADTLAGPSGLLNLADYTPNQPFYDMFKNFGEDTVPAATGI